MLSEEALLLIVAFAVLAFVIVALLETVWPTRRRRPRRHVRRDAPTAWAGRGQIPTAPPLEAVPAAAAPDPPAPPPSAPRVAAAAQVSALIQRQEFAAAREQVQDALAEAAVSADERGVLLDLLAATYSGEVGQLTAHAIRVMQEAHEPEALAALEQAETLLASAPGPALATARRAEVERRLWWGYMKLGLRRVEAGAFDEAIEPLAHALRFEAVDPDRRQETRAVLAQALIGMADGRATAIEALVREGRRQAALEAAGRLRARLDDGLALGLTREDLAPALDRARAIVERVAAEGGVGR